MNISKKARLPTFLFLLIICTNLFSIPVIAHADIQEVSSCPEGTTVGSPGPQSTPCMDASGNVVAFFQNSGLNEQASAQLKTQANTPLVCTASATNWGPIFNPICWLRMAGAAITSVFVWIGIKILDIAGFLFNYLMDFTVIRFSDLYGKIGSAVETGWTAFRDIANILIIGMFTFIALSIVLGLKQFGQKKMIAKVLIIAVLINFSLLFTKMIIDASNFTAAQFYNAALGQVAAAAPTQGSNVNVAPAGSTPVQTGSPTSGISGQFMQAIGVTGILDSRKQIRDVQDANDSGLLGIGFGILSLIFFLGAAIVLFYGCFLLVSRAILLIFLMVTASLAFASYLIPAWETSHYGWKTWWDSLLKCAVFAPLLMLFLWITLLIAKALTPITAGTTIGGVATAPDKNVAAIFGYLMILGLLFLSFKLSNMWAGKISGFSMTTTLAALPLTLASRFGGVIGRNSPLAFGGRRSASRALNLDTKIDEQKGRLKYMGDKDPGRPKLLREIESTMRAKQRAESRASGSYNMMNTTPAKALMAGLGVKGYAAGADTKPPSFAESSSARAAKATKEAAGLALSQDEKNAVRLEATETKFREKQDRKQRLKIEKEAHEKEYELKKKAIETEEQTLKSHQEREVKVKESIETKQKSELKAIADEIAKATDEDTRKGHTENYQKTEKAQKIEMQQQDNKISDIKDQLQTLTAPAEVVNKKLKEVNAEIESLGDDAKMRREAGKEAGAVVTEAETNVRNDAMKVGARLAYGTFTSALQKAVGIDPSKDTVAGRKAFKEIKKKIKQKKIADNWAAVNEATGGAAEADDKGESGSAPASGTH